MSRSKKIVGWAAFAVLFPFIALGWAANFIVEAVLFGWKSAAEIMENW